MICTFRKILSDKFKQDEMSVTGGAHCVKKRAAYRVCGGVKWVYLTQGRRKRRGVVDTVMQGTD
jgi:hypothetical protein